MALTANTPHSYEIGDYQDLPVKAATLIYEGAAVGDDGSGYARGLVAGDPFLGFAQAMANNVAGSNPQLNGGSGTAGNITVRVLQEGRIVLSVAGVTGVGDKRKSVYASSDGTFTLTASNNTPIGRVVKWSSGTTCVVEFDACNSIGKIAALTENAGAIGGTSDGNLPDLTVTAHALANSIGGTPSTSSLAAYSDLSTYATDAAAIRNNLTTLGNELALNKADISSCIAAIRELATKINEIATRFA